MKTTVENKSKRSTKIVDLKNGDVINEKFDSQDVIEKELKIAEEKVKNLRAKKRELRQVGSYSLTMKIVCEDPLISYVELCEKLTAQGIDCVAKKNTIATTYHQIQQVYKNLNKFGYISQ